MTPITPKKEIIDTKIVYKFKKVYKKYANLRKGG